MTKVLERIPIYTEFLEQERGVGPAMAGVLVTYLDPHKARHVSSFWRYAGLDVGADGRGRPILAGAFFGFWASPAFAGLRGRPGLPRTKPI